MITGMKERDFSDFMTNSVSIKKSFSSYCSEQMAHRVTFCDDLLRYDDEVLESICFSDESRVFLGTDKEWAWYRQGEDNLSANVESTKFPKGLMVFAVIGMWYKSKLLIVDGTINAEKYIENCEALNFIQELDERRGVFNWIFQQDGASCHTTQPVLDWLEESCDVKKNQA
jgi:hypothetical protein